MKWAVFASAPDEITALMWRDLVKQAGLPCELNPADIASYLGVRVAPVRLMTANELVKAAQDALRDVLGTDNPAATEEAPGP